MCVVNFNYHNARMADDGTLTVGAKGKCKFQTCSTFSFRFSLNILRTRCDAEMVIVQEEPFYHEGPAQKRQLSEPRREEVGQVLQEKGVLRYFYGEMASQQELVKAGNITGPQTPEVLRKCLSEVRKGESLHHNLLIELLTIRTMLRIVDNGSKIHPGYIQHFSVYLFTILLYTQKQIEILSDNLKSVHSILHLDATETLISKPKS